MTEIPLAGGGLDRAAHRRLADAGLDKDKAFASPDVLVLVMQDGHPLFDESGQRFLWLRPPSTPLCKDA